MIATDKEIRANKLIRLKSKLCIWFMNLPRDAQRGLSGVTGRRIAELEREIDKLVDPEEA